MTARTPVAYVGVIGDGACSPRTADLAREVGRLLAAAGCVVVCGGLGGVMEAACQGAKELKGLTVGILPGDDRRQANRFVDVPVVTGLGEARNVLVVKSSQAIVAVEGRYGTLSEIALALKTGVPVVGINTWVLQRDGAVDDGIVPAASPREAVALAVALAVEGSRRPHPR